VTTNGLELGLDAALTDATSAFVNYSYQPEPTPSFPGLTAAQALTEINIPAAHLVNAGISCLTPRWFGTLSFSHSTEAFWQDVLDSRFHGFTRPYTIVNLTIGTKWGDGKYSVALRATNLANDEVQQHIFGDVLRRQILGEFKVNLPR
jgi:outer membrane receptor protein involved in Fe transport